MKYRFFAGGLVLLSAVVTAPLPALADLQSGRSSEVEAAIDGAMAGGDTAALNKILAAMASADVNDAAAIAGVATRRIASEVTRDTEDRAKIVTADAITVLVAAAPAQTGTVLDVAQTNLPPELWTVAVSAAQGALSPAAGGKVMISQTSCIAPQKGLPCRTWHVPLNPDGAR